MNSMKCMTCGLRNEPDAGVCRRCGSAIPPSNMSLGSAIPGVSSGYVGQPGFIGDHIRRTNRNLLLTNTIMATVLVIAFAVCGRYFYNSFLGPFPVTEDALTSTGNASELSRYFVTVRIDNVMDYTVQEVKTRKRSSQEEVVSEYFAVVLGEKLLLVKSSPNHQEPNFTGSIENLSSSESSEIIRRFLENDPGARDSFLPIMLDATGFRGRGYIGLAIGIPLLLLNLWNIRKALARRAHPDQHPLMVSLARYGLPQAVAAQIELEVAAAGTKRTPSAVITASWLLNHNAFSLNLRSFDDIVWAYKRVTKHYTNFIPTGKTYTTVILDRHGKSLEINGRKEKDCDSLLEGIAERAPWVLVGYGDDLAMAWKSDAAAVIKAVDQRHSQALEPQQSTQGA